MDAEGFVQASFLLTFPRLAAICTNVAMLLEALLAQSTQLEVDLENEKVRLRDQWHQVHLFVLRVSCFPPRMVVLRVFLVVVADAGRRLKAVGFVQESATVASHSLSCRRPASLTVSTRYCSRNATTCCDHCPSASTGTVTSSAATRNT
jgi:hypothetical protein